jgi:GcrA cell cycle regulator
MESFLTGQVRLKMQSGDWTPEHSQALRDHVARGLSFARAAAEINARFGTAYTRNAAIGRGKRMGLIGAARRGDRPEPTKARRPAKARKCRDAESPRSEPQPETVPVVAAAPVMLRCVGMSPRLISLVELEPCDCRYPYGGDKDDEPIAFCGHPRRKGSSYCAPHFRLTRGVDTAAERAAGPVMLRLVEAA